MKVVNTVKYLIKITNECEKENVRKKISKNSTCKKNPTTASSKMPY